MLINIYLLSNEDYNNKFIKRHKYSCSIEHESFVLISIPATIKQSRIVDFL